MTRRPWTPAEIADLVASYPHENTLRIAERLHRNPGTVFAKAGALGLKKSDEYNASDRSTRIKRGRTDPRMMATQWQPGNPSWNKGTHYRPGGRSAETWFKPGQCSPRWDVEAYGIGALRITTTGELEIRVTPQTGRLGWWQLSHYVWWSHTGRHVGAGHALWYINRDPHDTRIENLERITRAELLHRNTRARAPIELRRLWQLKAAIARQVNRITSDATDTEPAR